MIYFRTYYNTTTVKGNPSLSEDITFTLPNSDGGEGQVLLVR